MKKLVLLVTAVVCTTIAFGQTNKESLGIAALTLGAGNQGEQILLSAGYTVVQEVPPNDQDRPYPNSPDWTRLRQAQYIDQNGRFYWWSITGVPETEQASYELTYMMTYTNVPQFVLDMALLGDFELRNVGEHQGCRTMMYESVRSGYDWETIVQVRAIIAVQGGHAIVRTIWVR